MALTTGDILIAGELFRLRVHCNRALIRDRRYHFRTYNSCFVGRDLIDWMISSREATSRENAVLCLKILQDNGVLHHVCDEHVLKDDYLFYRFRIDDGTFFVEPEFEIYQQAIVMHWRMKQVKDDGPIRRNSSEGEEYEETITGQDLISWIVKAKFAKDSTNACYLVDQMLSLGIQRKVGSSSEDIKNHENGLFQFIFDVKSHTPLYKTLEQDYEDEDGRDKLLQEAVQRLGLSPGKGPYPQSIYQRLWSGGSDADSRDGDSYPSSPNFDGNGNVLRPVVFRSVTAEELLSKQSPYVQRNIRVISDAVGFGFVVRGDGPCYVQTVDPNGPAASAGLKIRQYIYSVNGRKAVYMNHKDLAREIMKGSVVDLVVMQHFRSMSHE